MTLTINLTCQMDTIDQSVNRLEGECTLNFLFVASPLEVTPEERMPNGGEPGGADGSTTL